MRHFPLILALLLASGCAKELTPSEKGADTTGGRQFVASIDTYLSRTQLDGCKVIWNKGDEISVFDEDGRNFRFIAKNDGAATVFEQSTDTPGELSGSVFYALYPYSATASISLSSISCSTPTSYDAAPGSFSSSKAGIMTARTSDGSFCFKNLSSLLRMVIPSGSGISSIYIIGGGESGIAGDITMDIDEDGTPSVTQAPSSGKGITISPSEGSAFAAGVYYIPILPATYSSLRMKISYTSGTDNISDAFSLNQLSATRNKMTSIGTIYDGRDWYRWLTFENGVATCSYITEGNTGTLSVIDNPYPTDSNPSSKVLQDKKLNGTSTAYFTIKVSDINSNVRGRMKAVKYQIYLGKNEYYPRLVFNGGTKYLPASVNGIRPSSGSWTEDEWKAALKTDDWNTFCHPISQFTDASTWEKSASTIAIRPLSNFDGTSVSDTHITETNTRTVYIDNFGFTYTEVPEVRPEDKGYIKVKAKKDPDVTEWTEYNTLITDNLGYVPLSDKLNRYGSLAEGPVLNATGFYHTQKYNGRWYVVDPEGHLDIIAGVNSIAPGEGEDQKSAYSQRFGSKTDWFNETADLLWNTGFSCAGAWSDWESVQDYNSSHPERQIAYCPNTNLMSGFQKSKKYTEKKNRLIYVFDPDFTSWCETQIPDFVNQFKGDPNVLGYFSDNELPILMGSLKEYLSLPTTDYGYKAAKAWLQEKGIAEEDITDDDGKEFAGYVADTYYSIVVPLFKKYDPDHMFIGSRYSGSTKTMEKTYKAAAKWCDIVSINYYGEWEVNSAHMDKWESWADTPIIITEFYTKGEDSDLPNNTGAGWVVQTQLDRGYHYENFVIKLLRTDLCVGWHWFKYQDNDPTALSPSESNIDSNKGIVDNSYEAYDVLTERMKKINSVRHTLSQLD